MESISTTLGVVIMMNNYFHDVATGLLVASGFTLYLMMRHHDYGRSREADGYFLRIHGVMTRIARISFWWVILAGVPRTYFYREFEWAGAVEDLQVTAIVIKHVIVFAIVGLGIYMWIRLGRKVRQVRQDLQGSGGRAYPRG